MSEESRPSVLITGAAGGIGSALVAEFVEAGYLVLAVDRVAKPEGMRAEWYVSADLDRFAADSEYADDVVSSIRLALGDGCLNVLVNNAAIQILGGVSSLDRAAWGTTLNVNLLSPFLLCQALLPDIERAKGCIINISSVHARLTKRNFVAYATSKAALSGLTRAMAVDLGSRARVIGIEPAAVDTPMLRAGFVGNEPALDVLSECHPARMICDASTLAKWARLLAEESSAFLTGAILNLDGGISARLYNPL